MSFFLLFAVAKIYGSLLTLFSYAAEPQSGLAVEGEVFAAGAKLKHTAVPTFLFPSFFSARFFMNVQAPIHAAVVRPHGLRHFRQALASQREP